MNKNVKDRVVCIVMAVLLFGTALVCMFKPLDAYSFTERRSLKKFPQVSVNTILSGSFMTNFEDYTLDQFPLRDLFRGIKAVNELFVFQKTDNNKLYLADGHISKIEYPYHPDKITNAADKMNAVYERYLKDTGSKVYLSVIPDKNAFLAEKNGYLALDYAKLIEELREQTPNLSYIDIFSALSADDYYNTDTDWRQENLTDIAKIICNAMGAESASDYTVNELADPFSGVYLGQSALPLDTDTIRYLTNDTINGLKVFDGENQKDIPVYNLEAGKEPDAYELFLGGPLSIVTIENPNADTDRELIVIRDSFGSSIAPLLCESYAKVTLLDIRYLRSDTLEQYVTFDGQDVLFLYSTMVLNNSETFK